MSEKLSFSSHSDPIRSNKGILEYGHGGRERETKRALNNSRIARSYTYTILCRVYKLFTSAMKREREPNSVNTCFLCAHTQVFEYTMFVLWARILISACARKCLRNYSSDLSYLVRPSLDARLWGCGELLKPVHPGSLPPPVIGVTCRTSVDKLQCLSRRLETRAYPEFALGLGLIPIPLLRRPTLALLGWIFDFLLAIAGFHPKSSKYSIWATAGNSIVPELQASSMMLHRSQMVQIRMLVSNGSTQLLCCNANDSSCGSSLGPAHQAYSCCDLVPGNEFPPCLRAKRLQWCNNT
ncbi:hypothetical protein BDP27DRAFT_1360502 [Rhodocollybia butyracea]|uniref:Uncharacterized protein n=1 Tax=Rhodocollybia butyracea TaxID=206335 RepID=A0A9P5Q2N5_9AGAR|nr:hypothetical protein BDP27DRAFT_1360502 [Rhodocollybia butyracea]